MNTTVSTVKLRLTLGYINVRISHIVMLIDTILTSVWHGIISNPKVLVTQITIASWYVSTINAVMNDWSSSAVFTPSQVNNVLNKMWTLCLSSYWKFVIFRSLSTSFFVLVPALINQKKKKYGKKTVLQHTRPDSLFISTIHEDINQPTQ